jgi:hypothetical protein
MAAIARAIDVGSLIRTGCQVMGQPVPDEDKGSDHVGVIAWRQSGQLRRQTPGCMCVPQPRPAASRSPWIKTTQASRFFFTRRHAAVIRRCTTFSLVHCRILRAGLTGLHPNARSSRPT